MTPRLSRAAKDPVLSIASMLSALQAEHRSYRKAADRFHASLENHFETLRRVIAEAESSAHGEAAGSGAARKANPAIPESKALSKREMQILQLIAEGHGTKQAAEAMGIAFKTAVGHRSKLMSKLGIHDVVRLTRYAIRNGLIEP
jgi:DNA-binding NarL/FixJ family response regulator